ncbi:DUF1501 domain-containing protein [Planctomycetaceae bacterium SH139]
MENYVNHPTRRGFVKGSLALGTAASAQSWLGGWSRAIAAPARKQSKSVVMIWLEGGPATIDLWDMKPQHENGGPIRPIRTSVPGILISEHLPLLAQQMEHVALIRSMTSGEGDHQRALHLLRTGYRPAGAIQFPAFGSVLASELRQRDAIIPPFVSIAATSRLKEVSNGFLPSKFAPLDVVAGNANGKLVVPGLIQQTLQRNRRADRMRLLDKLDKRHLDAHASEVASSINEARKQASQLQDSSAAEVFNLDSVQASTRDRFGRGRFGQACLMASQLVQQQVPCVEVTLPGWDAHRNNFETVQRLAANLDRGLSALIDDLAARELLDSTLIICHGEFGRTPNINGNHGRDHFPNAWSMLLAGGGVRGGNIIGATSDDGMEVTDRPVKVPDVIASVCQWAGIDYKKQNLSNVRRPIRIADVDAEIIDDLFT